MKIGELASRTGLAASRIRFYEASGLISAQRQANGYREYPEQAVQTLGIISCAQQAGFSLEEIRRLLPDANRQQGWAPEEMHSSLQRKVGENQFKLIELMGEPNYIQSSLGEIGPDGSATGNGGGQGGQQGRVDGRVDK